MAIRVGTQPILRFYAGPSPTPADIYIAAVLAAGGTLSGAQQTAIGTFYNSLNTVGVYSKLHAMYPFMGGTASSNAIDFINPGGSYDLTFNGTWTHSVSGSSTADASGNYANTGLDPSLFNSTTNFSFGNMVVGASNSNGYSGIGNAAGNYIILGQAGLPTVFLEGWMGASSGVAVGTNYINGALQIVSRTGASAWTRNYVASGSAGTITTNSFTNTISSYSANLYFNDINGVANNNMSGRYLFGYAGEGLNATEIQNFSNAINTLQTAFSRNLW
jgi:hypothetical protein